MQRRAFLGLLVAAVGFRLKAEPTAPTYIGADWAAGPDRSGWVIVGDDGPEVITYPTRGRIRGTYGGDFQPFTREQLARLYDVPVEYIGGA